jgi:hypothetical protein
MAVSPMCHPWLFTLANDGPKRRQTRRLGSRYFIIILSFVFSGILTIYYLGSIYVLKRQGGWGCAMTTETGLNDAKRVIWALGTFFFPSCFLVYLLFFRFYLCFKRTDSTNLATLFWVQPLIFAYFTYFYLVFVFSCPKALFLINILML